MNGVRSVPLSNNPTYEGVWHGKTVRFERVFRGYALSDEECVALCNGHAIELHGLERHGVKYAVIGALQESIYPGLRQSFTEVKLKALKTIPYDPEYQFHIVEMPAMSSSDDVPPAPSTPVHTSFGLFSGNNNGISIVGMTGGAPNAEPASVSANDAVGMSDIDFINQFDPTAIAAQEDAVFQKQLEQSVEYGMPQLMPINMGDDTPRYIAVFKMLTQEQIDAAAAAASAQPLVYDPYYDARTA